MKNLRTALIHLFATLAFMTPLFCNQQAKYDVLGIGTAITDLVIPVSDHFLQTYVGEKGGATEVSVEKIDHIITMSQQTPTVKPGGSCANSLKGLGTLGMRTAFHFRVGDDSYGHLFQQSLKQHHVEPQVIIDPLDASGKLACLVTADHQRTFCVYTGASGNFCSSDLDPHLFTQATIVHIEGYALRNANLVERAMQLAKERGATISFDLGCFQLVREHNQRIKNLISSYVDILFGNEEEMTALWDLPLEATRLELHKIAPLAIILMGKNGCYITRAQHDCSVPSYPVPAIDTTGAGDFFISGFLYGYLQKWPIEKCAQAGNLLGSKVVQYYGASIPDEAWDEMKQGLRLLQQQTS